ncbi:hypothetical protein ACTHO0_13215 [Cytobacillus praedii]|uniref:hypothetical protein n=1 Tax=Cytobacillus praedii TaxID=1742358 RepID=UPI003F80D62C
MIPVKIGSNRITEVSQMSLESIIDWFDHHKVSFYTLGWSYFRNQEQIEELFYRVILKRSCLDLTEKLHLIAGLLLFLYISAGSLRKIIVSKLQRKMNSFRMCFKHLIN